MTTALFRFLTIALTLACVALVGTIEVLSHQAGDGIARKAQQESHSKWRLSSQVTERRFVEWRFREENEIPREQSLTSEQATEVERIARENWAKALPHKRLASAMRDYSAWGAPLGLLTFACGIAALRDSSTLLRSICCSIGAITLLITLVRYIPSLGW